MFGGRWQNQQGREGDSRSYIAAIRKNGGNQKVCDRQLRASLDMQDTDASKEMEIARRCGSARLAAGQTFCCLMLDSLRAAPDRLAQE